MIRGFKGYVGVERSVTVAGDEVEESDSEVEVEGKARGFWLQ
jgi:hypothetical protein